MSNWSLSRKIWSIVGLLTFAFVGTTWYQTQAMSRVTDNLNTITQTIVRRDQLSSEFRINQRGARIAALELVVYRDEKKFEALKKNLNDSIEKQYKDMDEYASIASDEEKKELASYRAQFEIIAAELRKVGAFGAKNDNDGAERALTAVEATIKQGSVHLKALNEYTEKMFELTSKAANEEAVHSKRASTTIAVLSISISLLIAFFVLRSLSKSISHVVASLFDNSAQVSSAATQISASADSLSQATSEQAASLEQTAASIEEMNQMVGRNSQNAGLTAKTSNQSQDKANQGREVVEKMMRSMDEINQSNAAIMDQVNASNVRFGEIIRVIEEIEGKTNVINDIVFQTKLLSFNASVEAARAGEHGKGFAVVAEEVGSLAQMSGNAAKEIRELLDGSMKKVNEIVAETSSKVGGLVEVGHRTVIEGTEVARQCGEVLEEIVSNVSSVSKMATDIASASDEQSKGVSEITKAMSQLDQVTQTNAETSQECASAAEELSAQAVSLKSAVGELVRTIEGGSPGSTKNLAQTQARQSLRKAVTTSKPRGSVSALPVRSKTPVAAKGVRKNVSGDATPAYDSEGFTDI